MWNNMLCCHTHASHYPMSHYLTPHWPEARYPAPRCPLALHYPMPHCLSVTLYVHGITALNSHFLPSCHPLSHYPHHTITSCSNPKRTYHHISLQLGYHLISSGTTLTHIPSHLTNIFSHFVAPH